MDPNGPITIIDAHRSIHQDSPLTGQLVQSISVLNQLLMTMMSGAQPQNQMLPMMAQMGAGASNPTLLTNMASSAYPVFLAET